LIVSSLRIFMGVADIGQVGFNQSAAVSARIFGYYFGHTGCRTKKLSVAGAFGVGDEVGDFALGGGDFIGG